MRPSTIADQEFAAVILEDSCDNLDAVRLAYHLSLP
jgi:hypothetical protein